MPGIPGHDGAGCAAQAEALFQQFKAKKEVLVGKNKESVVATYGSAAQPADDAALLLGQTEAYVEYDARGRLLRGDASAARSRYEEDVHPGNHTSVRARLRVSSCAGLRGPQTLLGQQRGGGRGRRCPTRALARRCGGAGGRRGDGATHAATRRRATATAPARRARLRPWRPQCRWR